jgi:hypothetical protein
VTRFEKVGPLSVGRRRSTYRAAVARTLGYRVHDALPETVAESAGARKGKRDLRLNFGALFRKSNSRYDKLGEENINSAPNKKTPRALENHQQAQSVALGQGPHHRSFAYSALACFRMGTSGSASFQSVRKSL